MVGLVQNATSRTVSVFLFATSGVFLMTPNSTTGLGVAQAQQAKKPPKPAASNRKAKPAPSKPAESSSFSSSGKVAAPPYVPNGAFRYESVESRNDCPVLMQIVDAPRLSKKKSGQSVGEAPLQWLAEDFRLTSRTATRATWQARLLEDYEKCEAKGYLSSRGRNVLSEDDSHIRIGMENGRLLLTLNLERLDAEATVTQAHVKGGIPTWSWRYTNTPSR